MKNKNKELLRNRKTSTGKKMIKAVAIIAAVNGGIKLFSMYSSRRSNQVDLPKGEFFFHFVMDGKQIYLDEDKVEKITLCSKMSGIDLDLGKVKELDGLRIECKSFMSGICIRVPKDISVKIEAKQRFSTILQSVPKYLDDSLPTVYITGNVYLSGINIRLIDVEE